MPVENTDTSLMILLEHILPKFDLSKHRCTGEDPARMRPLAYIHFLNKLEIKHHTPEQNRHVESFHKTLKKEYLWPHKFASYPKAEAVIVDAYRITTTLGSTRHGYVTPEKFLFEWEMRNK